MNNMAREKTQAEEHPRDDPLVIWTLDFAKLELFVDPVGVATGGNVTPIDNPRWTIRVKGFEYLDWEATVDERERDVQARALAWWDSKKGT